MSKFTETIGKAADKVTESTKNWNWGAIGTACAITGMIVSGIANVATKKQNQKAIVDPNLRGELTRALLVCTI